MIGMNSSRASGILRLLLFLQLASYLVSLVSCMPQQISPSSSGGGNNNNNNDDDSNGSSEIARKYPSDLSYQNVVIRYELDHENEDDAERISLDGQSAAAAAAADAPIRLADSGWNNKIDEEKQTIMTELVTDQDFNYFFSASLIKFVQPVRFKSVRIIYTREDVTCSLRGEGGEDEEEQDEGESLIATMRPGSPATFDLSTGQQEKVKYIACLTESMNIYSEL